MMTWPKSVAFDPPYRRSRPEGGPTAAVGLDGNHINNVTSNINININTLVY